MGARYIKSLFVAARTLSKNARCRCYWMLVEL